MAINVEKLLEEYDAVVFDKDNCGECRRTEDLMTELGINFTTLNMSHDKDALQKVKADKHRQAPAVYTATESWSGHKPEKVLALGNVSIIDDDDEDTWDF